MSVRTWRGRASPSRPHAYIEHFSAHVLPELQTIPGFCGASLLQAERPGEIEFLMLTRSTSLEAIRAFVEPGARAALTTFDESVTHYKVVLEV